MTRNEQRIFDNSIQQHLDSLTIKRDTDDSMWNLSDEDLYEMAVDLAEAGFDDYCDSKHEEAKDER